MFDFPTPAPDKYSEAEQAHAQAELVRAVPGSRNRRRVLRAMALLEINHSEFTTQGRMAELLQDSGLLPQGDWESVRATFHKIAYAFDSRRAELIEQVSPGKERR